MKSKIAKLFAFVLAAGMLFGMVALAEGTQTNEALGQRIESAFSDANIEAIITDGGEDGIYCTNYDQLYSYFEDEVTLGASVTSNDAGAWYVSTDKLFTSTAVNSEWEQYYENLDIDIDRTVDELKEFCAKAKEYYSAMQYGKRDDDLMILCDTLDDNLGYKLPEDHTYLMFSTGKLTEGDTAFAKAISPNEDNRYLYKTDVFAVVENADNLEAGTLYMLKSEMDAFEARLDATWAYGKHEGIDSEADIQTYRNKCFNLFEEIVNAIKIKENAEIKNETISIILNNTDVSQEGNKYTIESDNPTESEEISSE